MSPIADAIARIRRAMQAAAIRAGRLPTEITLIAAAKGASIVQIEEAWHAGVHVFGENRVQEARGKWMGFCPHPPAVLPALHLIGPLQTNKVKQAVGFFEVIHSVDTVDLAQSIQRQAERLSITQAVLIQVNLGDEPTKRGVPSAHVFALIDAVRRLPNLALLGLMAIPPRVAHPESARVHFAALRQIGRQHQLHHFSMGMSSDFEVAIEEGATWVRVGQAIFVPPNRLDPAEGSPPITTQFLP